MKKLFLRAEFGPLWGPWEVDETPRKVIPHESREVHSNSPHHGLAGVVKNKFLPREAKPRVVGICFSPQLLNHKWGIGMKLE